MSEHPVLPRAAMAGMLIASLRLALVLDSIQGRVWEAGFLFCRFGWFGF